MKRYLLLFALCGTALAQSGVYGPGVSHSTSSPAGVSCGSGAQPIQYDPSGVLYTCQNGTYTAVAGTSTGTVSTVSVVTANGVSGSVANASTTPAITLTLGAIAPTSVTIPADGVHAQQILLAGQTANFAVAGTGVFGWAAPLSTSFTSYIFQPTATNPAGTQIMLAGTPVGGYSPVTYAPVTGTGSFLYNGGTKLTGSAQGGNISLTTLATAPATVGGTAYLVCWYARETQAATSSSTLGGVTVHWTDAATNTDPGGYSLNGYNSAAGNGTWVTGGQCVPINAYPSTIVTVTGAGYASSGATPMQFTYMAYAEALP